RELNRDEEQFISAGALFARHGYLPYLDYPYFHVPNLDYIYVVLFTQSNHLLLTARAFNILCAWLTLLLIFWLSARLFKNAPAARWSVAILATVALFTN